MGTTWTHSAEEIKAVLSEFYEDAEFVDRESGGFSYRHRAEGMFKTKIYWTDGRDDICVMLPGKACEFLGLVNVLAICTLLNLRLSRLDWCFDHCPFTVEQVRDSWHANDVNSKVPRDSWDEFRNAKGHTFW